jgi:hypothetical protein
MVRTVCLPQKVQVLGSILVSSNNCAYPGSTCSPTFLQHFTLETNYTKSILFASVLRIRDILVRIRISGSVPLTNGSGSDSGSSSGSWYFRQRPSRLQVTTNNYFFSMFFCLLLFEVKFTSFFKDK